MSLLSKVWSSLLQYYLNLKFKSNVLKEFFLCLLSYKSLLFEYLSYKFEKKVFKNLFIDCLGKILYTTVFWSFFAYKCQSTWLLKVELSHR